MSAAFARTRRWRTASRCGACRTICARVPRSTPSRSPSASSTASSSRPSARRRDPPPAHCRWLTQQRFPPNRHRQAAGVALGRIGKRPRQSAMYAPSDRDTGERVEKVVAGGAFGRRAVHHRRRKTGFDQQAPTQRKTRLGLLRRWQRARSIETPKRKLGMCFAYAGVERAIALQDRVHFANLGKNTESKNGDAPRRVRSLTGERARTPMGGGSRLLIAEGANFCKHGAA